MQDLITGRFLQKYTIQNEDVFKSNTPEMYWLLGMMASDGCITNNNRITIAQSDDKGKCCIEKIKSIYGIDNPIYSHNPIKGNTVYEINFASDVIINDLKLYNIVPRKTLNYTLPKTIPYSSLNKFIEGYIEGDGTVGVYTNNREYKLLTILVVGTKEFIYELNNVVPVSGYITKIERSSIYELRWTGRKAVSIGNWIYTSPVYDNSPKYKKFLGYINTITPDYVKYDIKKSKAQQLLNDGYSVKVTASMIEVPFQTIYKWIKKGVLIIDK